MIMAAIEDAERLVDWIAPNSWALQDPIVEAAVLRALGGPVPDHLLHRQDASGHVVLTDLPLLRFADGREAMSLLDAVMYPPIPRYTGQTFVCDYFGDKASEPNTIWIPCGSSVVQLTVRNFAREHMQDDNRAHLVWWDAD